MICPVCGKECDAEFVDNGVGLQQCGPYQCVPSEGGCGWVQDVFLLQESNMNKEPYEGDDCPKCGEGFLEFLHAPCGLCSCRIDPPCNNCVNSLLACSKCKYEHEGDKNVN